jgi:hypothetical protein|tara:strand:- start:3180 stop:3392 length:213 start_codon:yes stop_codon:yes gene_type:complete
MSEREEMLEELVEECLERIDELESRLSEQESKFEAFAEPCAIGSEQLWKVVFNDILKRPVPSGVDLRDLV